MMYSGKGVGRAGISVYFGIRAPSQENQGANKKLKVNRGEKKKEMRGRRTSGGKTNCFCSSSDLLIVGSHKAGRGKGETVFFAPKAR